MIILRGVNVFPTQIEEQSCCATPSLARHFQIVLSKDDRRDRRPPGQARQDAHGRRPRRRRREPVRRDPRTA